MPEAIITFDNALDTYYPGQQVNGTVEYNFDKPKSVRSIYIRFKGKAKASWTVRANKKTRTYTGREEFFKFYHYVIGSKSSGSTNLPAGRHVFNFTYTLPSSLPSSFEGKHGYIRYAVKTTLDRPLKFDQKSKKGFTVQNYVDLNQNPLFKVCIYIRFKGKAKASWNKRINNNNRSYTGHEEFFKFDNYVYVIGSSSSGYIEIPAGRHVFNFTYTLPSSLPSSFEGKHGFIRFTVKAIIDRPFKSDQKSKRAFTVLSFGDFNQNSLFKSPIHMQKEKTLYCACFETGRLTVDARAPADFYRPGEEIALVVDVDNQADEELTLMKVSLRQLVTYKAAPSSNQTMKTEDAVVEREVRARLAMGSARRYELALVVPATQPPIHCRVIDVNYDVAVKCVMSGIHTNLVLSHPVTIGSPAPPPLSAPPCPGGEDQVPPMNGQPPGELTALPGAADAAPHQQDCTPLLQHPAPDQECAA